MLKCKSKKWELLKTDDTTSWTTLFELSITETSARSLTREKRTPSPNIPRRYAIRGRDIGMLSKRTDRGTISTFENDSSTLKKVKSLV